MWTRYVLHRHFSVSDMIKLRTICKYVTVNSKTFKIIQIYKCLRWVYSVVVIFFRIVTVHLVESNCLVSIRNGSVRGCLVNLLSFV